MNIVPGVIQPSARLARGYVELLLKGITPQRAARKPRGEGGAIIDTNHPAFVLGHLSLYPARAIAMIGMHNTVAAVPAAWETLFKAGVACEDDPDGVRYPPLDELRTFYFAAVDAAIAAVGETADEVFVRPNPSEAARERFPTVGAAVNFYLAAHTMSHAGQISVWRRCVGLPSAM